MRCPRVRAQAALVIGAEHRSPDGPAHVQGDGIAAFHLHGFLEVVEGPPAPRRHVPVGVHRIDVEQDEVAGVGLRVGESPGDERVASGDQRRVAGERDAFEEARLRRISLVAPFQHGAIPRVGHADVEVHVVGHERPPVGRELARHRPVVAAQRGVSGRRGPRVRQVAGGDLATVLQVDLGAPVALAPQVVHVRPRHVAGGEGLADHRRIPLGAARGEQVEHAGRQHVVHRRQHRLVRPAGVLQCHEHRQHDEQAVFGRPRLRRLPQDEVLERVGAQRGQAAVDAGGISLEHRAVARRQHGQRLPCFLAEPVHPHVAVERQRLIADQRRQLTGRAPPGQVHLEKPILRVDVAGGPGHVFAGDATDGGDAERVALYGYGGLQSTNANRPVDLRQAGAKLRPGPVRAATERNGKRDPSHDEDTNGFAHQGGQ
jgi:hypothetical protein